jgi:threonylcarbamoyladenosine tRNA methylthiotransferase MtaB
VRAIIKFLYFVKSYAIILFEYEKCKKILKKSLLVAVPAFAGMTKTVWYAMSINTLSFGCRLNAMECEKIATMLAHWFDKAIIVNTCSVTAEAERQCAQAIRKTRRENPDAPIFITGCGATRAPEIFEKLGVVISNADKMKLEAYLPLPRRHPKYISSRNSQSGAATPSPAKGIFSKAFVQVQNGCNWNCTYCITRILRGSAVSFDYDTILDDVRAATANGFFEIVLTGIDIASYPNLCDLCKRLLTDVPEIRRLRLSSMDPASTEIPKIIELMRCDARMMPHLHLSMQSGSDPILGAMKRRHNAQMVRQIMQSAPKVSFSWDIICGFPGETDELFNQTAALARELKPIKIHAFPFSPRPGTTAADMPNHIPRNISKQRVKTMTEIANENLREFMKSQIGKTLSIMGERGNVARTPDDIEVKFPSNTINDREICNVKIIDVENNSFIAMV